MLTPQFQYHGRKGNQFYDYEFAEFLLGHPFDDEKPSNLTLSFAVDGKNGDRYTANMQNDGKVVSLDATLTKNGAAYKTTMTAKQVKGRLFEITELTFDNHKERIDSRWELTKVLAHIGDKQLKEGAAGRVAEPHTETGKFGKFRRFLSRMTPNDPSVYSGIPPVF